MGVTAQEFGDLVQANHGLLVGYLNHSTKDWQLAEDIAQNTYTHLWALADTLPTISKTLLFHCAGQRLIDHYRRRRHPCVDLDEAHHVEDGDDWVEKLAVRDEAQAILSTMTQSERRIIAYLIQGASYRDIAEATGMALGTVKSRINYIRTRPLRQQQKAEKKEQRAEINTSKIQMRILDTIAAQGCISTNDLWHIPGNKETVRRIVHELLRSGVLETEDRPTRLIRDKCGRAYYQTVAVYQMARQAQIG